LPWAGAAVGQQAGGEVPRNLDQVLAVGMERSPDIAAAKAKLQLAEAELNGVRMEVAGKIITAWNEFMDRENALGLAQRSLDRASDLRKKNAMSEADFDDEKKAEWNANRAYQQSEINLRNRLGLIGPGAIHGGDSAAGAAPSHAAAPLQLPHGPMVEKVRQALSSRSQLVLTDTPFTDVVQYLKELHRIEIQIDKDALGVAQDGFNVENKLTFEIGEVPLAAVIQAIEDKCPPLKFVVRDYGILVTHRDRAQKAGYFPVVEFVRLSGGDAAAPAVPNAPLRPVPPAK
jgi:hypothetical protein